MVELLVTVKRMGGGGDKNFVAAVCMAVAVSRCR